LFWINVDSLSNFRLQDENFIFNNKFFSLFKNLNVSNELKKEIFKQMMLESKKNSQYTVGMSQILNVDTFNYLFHELPWNHVELKAFFKNNIPYFVDSDHFFSCSQISNSDKIELFKDYL
jgi:hypothetical protein